MLIRETELQYTGRKLGTYPIVREPAQAAMLFRTWIGSATVEKFACVHLDGRHRALGSAHVVSSGTLTASLVHPRELFRAAIQAGSSSVLIAHNHPSGDPAPSAEDKNVTQRLAQVGHLIGIAVLDHLIVTESEHFYSFSESAPDYLKIQPSTLALGGAR